MRPITPKDIQRAPSNLVFSGTNQLRTQNCSMLLLVNEVEKLGRELALVNEAAALKEAELDLIIEKSHEELESAQDELKLLKRQVRIDTLEEQFSSYRE